MALFIGNYDAKADSKGRIFIPAHYRKLLSEAKNERLALRKDPYSCSLMVYPEKVWNRKLESLQQGLDEWNPTHQRVLMQYVAEAEWLDIDSQGRVLISKKYLQLIEVETDVKFVGMLDTFSLWSKKSFEEAKYSPETFTGLLQQIMSKDGGQQTVNNQQNI